MPRTELPSGGWIEWSDRWMSGVRFAVKSAVVYETTVPVGGGAREVIQKSDEANDDRRRVALWEQQITAWSFADQGVPIPSQNVARAQVIWSVLDGPDFNALADATQGLLDEVTATPTSGKASGKPSSTP